MHVKDIHDHDHDSNQAGISLTDLGHGQGYKGGYDLHGTGEPFFNL